MSVRTHSYICDDLYLWPVLHLDTKSEVDQALSGWAGRVGDISCLGTAPVSKCGDSRPLQELEDCIVISVLQCRQVGG